MDDLGARTSFLRENLEALALLSSGLTHLTWDYDLAIATSRQDICPVLPVNITAAYRSTRRRVMATPAPVSQLPARASCLF
jgi:hypothetical protein